jgi:GST-like protein
MAEDWEPPTKIEAMYNQTEGNLFASINAPTSGARTDDPVPRGEASFQLYSLATPNGQKVGVLLEELGIEYDAFVTNIGLGEQFSKGFVEVNPNSKIPCGVDYDPAFYGGGGGSTSTSTSISTSTNTSTNSNSRDTAPVRLFESGSMMMYLAEKHRRFLPAPGSRARAECLNWLMWQMAGQGPMTGNFGHFMVYAPGQARGARDYGVARYGMEVQRLCAVLDGALADGRPYLCGGEYTIADMACLPWFQMLRTEKGYRHANGVGARGFLSVACYEHAGRWADRLLQRPQVQRGLLVCRKYGKPWLEDDRFKHLAKL